MAEIGPKMSWEHRWPDIPAEGCEGQADFVLSPVHGGRPAPAEGGVVPRDLRHIPAAEARARERDDMDRVRFGNAGAQIQPRPKVICR